jgi:hypothetical protein
MINTRHDCLIQHLDLQFLCHGLGEIHCCILNLYLEKIKCFLVKPDFKTEFVRFLLTNIVVRFIVKHALLGKE